MGISTEGEEKGRTFGEHLLCCTFLSLHHNPRRWELLALLQLSKEWLRETKQDNGQTTSWLYNHIDLLLRCLDSGRFKVAIKVIY